MKIAHYPTAEKACEALAAAEPGVSVFWNQRYIGTRRLEDYGIDRLVILHHL